MIFRPAPYQTVPEGYEDVEMKRDSLGIYAVSIAGRPFAEVRRMERRGSNLGLHVIWRASLLPSGVKKDELTLKNAVFAAIRADSVRNHPETLESGEIELP